MVTETANGKVEPAMYGRAGCDGGVDVGLGWVDVVSRPPARRYNRHLG